MNRRQRQIWHRRDVVGGGADYASWPVDKTGKTCLQQVWMVTVVINYATTRTVPSYN